MNLYYLNQRINEIRLHAKVNSYYRWRLGELLHELDLKGLHISQDASTGHITVYSDLQEVDLDVEL